MTALSSCRLSLALTMLALAACGGGGGGGSNSAPSAVADSYAVAMPGGSLSVAAPGTLANDTDTNGDPLTAVLVSNVSNGTLALNPNGSFSYTHNGGSSTRDAFSYRANDGSANSNTVTVTLTINRVPVAVADSYTVAMPGGSLSVAAPGVLTNDTDADNAPLTAVLVSNVSNGTLALNPNGSFSYTHNGSSTRDSFSYRASDGTALSNIVTVTLNITPNNLPPVASEFCDNLSVNVSFNGDLRNVVTDADSPNLLFSVINNPGNGTLTGFSSSTGRFTYTPNAGFRGTDTFTFMVDDQSGNTVTETARLIIGPTRIMPLGDSIVAGTSAGVSPPPNDRRVGFRQKLFNDLTAANFRVDFVGRFASGVSAGIADPHHEGHGGATAGNLIFGPSPSTAPGVGNYTGIYNAINEAGGADIILLHIGTNSEDPGNFSPGPVPGVTNVNVAGILDEIQRWENDNHPATVIVARMINQNPLNPNVETLNDQVVTLVQNRIANSGDDLIIVDMQNALSYPTDLSDTLHPTAAGYEKMAGIWLHAIAGDGFGTPTINTQGADPTTGLASGLPLIDRCAP